MNPFVDVRSTSNGFERRPSMQIFTDNNSRRFTGNRLLAFIVVTLLVFTVQAQDALTVAPQAYKLALENDWIRVIRVRYAPYEKLPSHDHPKRQSIFVYLNDGGPVKFQHVEGDSGNYAATRPPTKARAFRLARGLSENHVVENLSAVPSEFLQIELKTEKAETEKFRGRFYREPRSEEGNYRKVEFENAQLKITRIGSAANGKVEPIEIAEHPGLIVALSPAQLSVAAKGGRTSKLRLKIGDTRWLEPGSRGQQNPGKAPAEVLLIELKTKPVADDQTKPHTHKQKGE